MSTYPTTHLVLLFHPGYEKHVLSLLSEIIFPPQRLTVIDAREETLALNINKLFSIPYQEKRLTFALFQPLSSEHIQEIARLVATGLLSGMIVRGEIDLGGQVINNLATLEDIPDTRSHHQEEPACSEGEESTKRYSEREHYLLAVDTGTIEYYYDTLRREAFSQDEERRSPVTKRE